MDRTIEKKKGWPAQRLIVFAAVALVAIVVIWQLLSRTSGTRLSVDSGRLTTGVVQRGEFLEYYPFDGTVQPATSVYLDIEEGGRVDEIFVEGGAHVEKGDLILRFSNASLQQNTIDTETRLLENLDIQRNTEFNRAQSGLLLKETLLDLDHQIVDLEKKYKRYEELVKDGNTALSAEAFETTRDQLKYMQDKRVLMAERIRQEDMLSAKQIAQAQKSIDKLNTSMELLGRIVKSLEVRAPISGYLSTIDAEVGQSIGRGQRIGQIDLLDKFKVRVGIDQYYISRVEVGTPGHVSLDGQTWTVKVQKIYPEVKNNAFSADVVFAEGVPESLKRGQTLTIELSFGSPSQSLTVAKGGFYQQTSGRWVYLVSQDGRTARRANVRLGRQNPRQVEVLEGLQAGDRIITSSYDAYNGVDELKFSEALKPLPEKTAQNNARQDKT
jgi:HlyD family secretion protein